MKPKVVKGLSDIEIDEVSLVDRSANQHAAVAIAKRAPEEENMPELYTEDGTLLDEDALEDGQVVYDGAGNAYQFTLDAEEDEPGDEPGEDDGEEYEEGEDEGEEVEEDEPELELAGVGKSMLPGPSRIGQPPAPKTAPSPQSSPFRAGAGLSKPKTRQGVAGGGAMPQRPKLGAAGARPTVAKSFQEQVMEELSKAYTDEDRDEVLSKAFSQVDAYRTQAEDAVRIAKSERDLRLTNEYISKAAEYNVPVDPSELGPVLYRMTEAMSYEDCSVIHKCLEAAGAAIFDEVGFIGGGDNVDVLDQVDAQAKELVGKADNTSVEAAWDSVFESNPGAYDEYLAQSRRGY